MFSYKNLDRADRMTNIPVISYNKISLNLHQKFAEFLTNIYQIQIIKLKIVDKSLQ